MVEVSAYNDIFIAASAGNVCQHIIHFQRTVCALLEDCNGVGVYLPAPALLSFLAACLKRLVIAVFIQRADAVLFQTGYDIAGRHSRTVHTCFTSLQFIASAEVRLMLCNPFSSGDCACKDSMEKRRQAVPKDTLCILFRF